MCKVLTLVLLVLLISCGKKNSRSGQNDPGAGPSELVTDGDYRSVLKTMNTTLKGHDAFGTAILKVSDGKFSIKLNLAHVPAGIKHIQSIHTEGKCPTITSDENGDSFIDIVEGMTAFGKVLIPLDGDLSAQLPGLNYFPKGNSSSAYSYAQETDLSALFSDLSSPDEDAADSMAKLRPGEALNFERRTLVISGISANGELPASVRTIGDFSGEAYIPVACGEIVRIKKEE